MVAGFAVSFRGTQAVIRRFSWFSIALLLPLLGWIGLVPLLFAFPIYSDELQWKLLNSRLLLDSGKLLYLFPACTKSILLDPPITWYPLQLIDAIIYSDMTNPQVLRYWGIAIFAVIVLYCAWFVRFNLRPGIGYAAIVASVLAPLSFGVLPFLLVMNRPEQGLIVVLIFGCSIPLILGCRKLNTMQTWALALLFVFLSWGLVSTHIKGLFLLPALLLAAVMSIRKWTPSLAVLGATGFGAFETYRLWSIRTDCPESPFLMKVFRGQSLSPDDLHAGLVFFLKQAWQNVLALREYWRSAGFQEQYQSQWLPPADGPPTYLETFLNAVLPASVAVGVVFVLIAFAFSIARAIHGRARPDNGPVIGMSLIASIVGIAGFQSGKNFYEAALILPLFGMAVMFALTTTALPTVVLLGGRKFMTALAVLALVNQFTMAFRFYPSLPSWEKALQERPQMQNAVRDLIGRCGIEANATAEHLLVDDFTYTVLWRTRQPYFLALVNGWWATGVNPADIIRDRHITAAVGACYMVSEKLWGSILSEGGYCCAKRS